MDKAGRVVIPKVLCEELHLKPGDSLELKSDGKQITLRPVHGAVPFQNKHGIWVLDTGEALAASVTDDLLRQIGEERDLTNLGDGFDDRRPEASKTGHQS